MFDPVWRHEVTEPGSSSLREGWGLLLGGDNAPTWLMSKRESAPPAAG
jgi:hypothetical protein